MSNQNTSSPKKDQPSSVKVKKLSKLQQAQLDYQNQTSYNFMKTAQVSLTKGAPPKTSNYWTANQRIIKSYAKYYENPNGVSQVKYEGYGNTELSPTNQGSNYDVLSLNNQSQSVPPRKGTDYMKNAPQQSSGQGHGSSSFKNLPTFGSPFSSNANKLTNKRPQQEAGDQSSNSVLKQAYLFPDISKNMQNSQIRIGTTNNQRNQISNNRPEFISMGAPSRNMNGSKKMQSINVDQSESISQANRDNSEGRSGVRNIAETNRQNSDFNVIKIGDESNFGDPNMAHMSMTKHTNIPRGYDGGINSQIGTHSNIQTQSSAFYQALKNKSHMSKSDSIVSGMIRPFKNGRAKNIRNFNQMYDANHDRSDKFREMKEKYKIGDGAKDVNRKNFIPYTDVDQSSVNINSEFNIRQKRLSDATLQNAGAKSIFGRHQENSIIKSNYLNQPYKIQEANENIEQGHIKKMISRDQNGKIDIVNVENSNQQSKMKSDLKQYNMRTEESDATNAFSGPKAIIPLEKSLSSTHNRHGTYTDAVSQLEGSQHKKQISQIGGLSSNPIDQTFDDNTNYLLSQTRPVLKKQLIHNSKNVFISFKSIEIQLIEEKFNFKKNHQDFKFLTPIYVPLQKLNCYMDFSKGALEIKLLKSIYPVTNEMDKLPNETRFMFVDNDDIMNMQKPVPQKFMSKKVLNKRKVAKNISRVMKSRLSIKRDQSNVQAPKNDQKSLSNQRVNSLSSFQGPAKGAGDESQKSQTYDDEPQYNQTINKIKTHLLTADHKEYKVLISLPKIEYQIESENFIFIKTLNKYELQDYLNQVFTDWPSIALGQLMSMSKFQTQLLDIQNKHQCGFNIKSKKYGKNGEITNPMDLESRNYRITKKNEEVRKYKAVHSHSHVPGQCKHQHISQERQKDNYKNDQQLNNQDQQPHMQSQKTILSEYSMPSQAESHISTPKILQPCIFEMREKTLPQGPVEKIKKYNSMEEYEGYFLRHDNVSNLKGCFEKDNTIGQISLNSFNVSIKSLVTDFSYSKNIKLDQWEDLCGFMKKQVQQNQNQPGQLVDLIVKIFQKKALRDEHYSFDFENINLSQFRPCFNQVEQTIRQQIVAQTGASIDVLAVQGLKKHMKIVQHEFMQLQQRSKLLKVDPIFNLPQYLGKHNEPLPEERFLIEITNPSVQIAYKDSIYQKQLTELDVEYLIRAKFQKWMQFLINSHFRVELNVGQDQPIPRIQEFMTQDELSANEIFLQNDIELQDAMGRDDISFNKASNSEAGSPIKFKSDQQEIEELGQARSKLSKWFPV